MCQSGDQKWSLWALYVRRLKHTGLLMTNLSISMIWCKSKWNKESFFIDLNIQCWFKLSGRNQQNLNFQTRFSQIGLRLDKMWRGQKLLRISPELIWCHFFTEILNKNFTPKMGHFGFFQLIKNYAETTLLIDMKIISQEASYAAQHSLRRVKSPKIWANCLKFFLNRDSGFYIVKITFIDYQVKVFSFILVFGNLTLLKLC